MNRPPRNVPVDPPAGYRWHLDTGTFRNVGIGVLMLVDDDAYTSATGMLWINAVPVGKKKPKPRPYFPRASRDIDRENQVRRRSRAIVREHYRLASDEHASALAAARIREGLLGDLAAQTRRSPIHVKGSQPTGPTTPAAVPTVPSGISRSAGR